MQHFLNTRVTKVINYEMLVEQGDIDETLTAASAIGHDCPQKQARGYGLPESFTHGTS